MVHTTFVDYWLSYEICQKKHIIKDSTDNCCTLFNCIGNSNSINTLHVERHDNGRFF